MYYVDGHYDIYTCTYAQKLFITNKQTEDNDAKILIQAQKISGAVCEFISHIRRNNVLKFFI